MEQSEQNAVTNLPRPASASRPAQPESPPGETIFDVRSVSISYGAFKAVTGRLAGYPRE